MNNVNINDVDFVNSNSYIDFMNNNQGIGHLKVRSYAANQAIPIKGLKIDVYKYIGGYYVNFFEGYTNESGVIENISLPAPKQDSDDLVIPKSTSYEIVATYIPDKTKITFVVNAYDNLYVVQNISIVPKGGI